MMLKVLGSNSKGNCYLLENDTEALVIEAGVPSKEVLKEVNFNLSKITGVLLTHEHGDHSKYIHEWRARGVRVCMSGGTATALNISHCNHVVVVEKLRNFRIGGFRIIPFEVQHDCNEPLGFLINHDDTGNILFVTDTFYIKNRFKDLRHILIECNYVDSILNESDKPYRDRVLSSHMSLETCLEFLKANDLSWVENIVLTHLSDSHSDEKMMRQKVVEVTGINTIIADKGIKIELGW